MATLVPLKIADISLQREFYMINLKDKIQTSVTDEFVRFLVSYCSKEKFICAFSRNKIMSG